MFKIGIRGFWSFWSQCSNHTFKIVVGYCEYFAFYTYEHTHETQTARDTCKFPLPSLYVSGELRRAAASDALLSIVLSSLVRWPSNITHGAGKRRNTINHQFFYYFTQVFIINHSTTSNNCKWRIQYGG